MLLILSVLLFSAWLVYEYANSYFNYWRKRGVPQVDGRFPTGSSPNIILSKRYQGYDIQEYYNKLSPHPYGGFYRFVEPSLLLRDPELIQHVLIKDFSCFRNRFKLENNDAGGITDQTLFVLEGDKWRALRMKLTPTFTSGKLKQMFSIFDECSQKFTERINREIKVSENINVKEFVNRFTQDLIVTCAFGIELNHMNDQESQFTEIGKAVFPKAKPFYGNFVAMMRVLFPTLSKRLPSPLPSHLQQFMIESISDTIKYREENNVSRNDFLNLLIDLKNKGHVTVEKGDEKELDSEHKTAHDIEIDLKLVVAQCLVFFLAGFETSSSVLTGALFELAVNQDMQDKLRQEIKETREMNEGTITYQPLIEMKYLDQVIKETLRKYPTLPYITRVCVKKYKVPNGNLVIDPGTTVIIPIYALHHDPKYFPEPEKFDPERFSGSNEKNFKPCTYLPFGEGSRICIGMRFGMLQTKMGLTTVLSNFKVSLSKESVNPLQFTASPLVSTTSHPVILKFEKL